jgi:hypothetical protein
MANVLSTFIEISLDADWYLATYPQAKKDIEAGLYDGALDHYLRVGIRDGLLSLEPVVNEELYRELYPDVDRAIKDGSVQSAQQHYTTWGYRERRTPVGPGDAFSYQPKRPRLVSFAGTLRPNLAAPRQLPGNADADPARWSEVRAPE